VLFIDNDHSLQLVGLKNASTHAYLVAATVELTLLAGSETGAEVPGVVWPVALGYVDPSADDIGGEAANPTTVKSVRGWDMTVTVGATTPLSLSAGRFIHVLHSDYFWRVIRAATGAADADVELHLEPVTWPGDEDEPTAALGTTGEIVEIIDGTYSGIMDKAVTLTDGEDYVAKIIADESDLDGAWYLPLSAQYRS
jgi:hypothetical protein